MALFHLSVTQTKRSAGQSAIASAAYRSGEKLYSEYYGEYSDYTRKGRRDLLRNSLAAPCAARIRRPPDPMERRREKPSVARTPSLHTALTLPCRMNFPLRKTSLLQGNFCWRTL